MKLLRVLLSVWFITFFIMKLSAQRYPFSEINIDNGLPQSVVYDVFQDSKGFIWFSTQDGVGRFDGMNFSYYSLLEGLIDNMARKVEEDANQKIWIATDRGISWFNDKTNTVSTFEQMRGIGSRSLLPFKNGMIIGTVNNGIYWVFGDTIFHKISVEDGLAHNRVYGLVIKNDTLYAGTDGGVSIIQCESINKPRLIKNLTKENGLITNGIRSVIIGLDNQIWAAGYDDGISIISANRISKITGQNGLPKGKINEMYYDSTGKTVWVASDGSGLYRIKKNEIVVIDETMGLVNNSLQTVFKDKESNLWLGTWGSGVYRLKYTNVILYDRSSGLPENNVTAVYAEKTGKMWIGTNNKGLTVVNGTTKTLINSQNSDLPTDRIFAIFGKNNKVYVGTDHGIVEFNGNKISKSYFTHSKDRKSVRSIYVDSKNSIWVGLFGGGAVKFSSDLKPQLELTRENGLLNDSIFAITELKTGEVALGSDGGVTLVKNNKISRYLTQEQGLIDNRISSICEDSNGNLWIGTYKSGLTVFKKDTILYYSISNGLPSNLISFINEDETGAVWVGTKKGVSKFIGDSLSLYSTQNGLISNEMNSNASYYINNKMLLGSVNGLSIIDLNELEIVESASPVYINKISIWGDEIQKDQLEHLDYNQNFISIHYTSPYFSNPDLLEFEYRLLGFETQWNKSKQRSVQYTNLKHDNYVFQVRSINGFGKKSENIAELAFNVLPAFWETASFRITILGLLFFLIYLGVRYNSERLRKQNLFLEAEVKKRTDELSKRDELFRIISENAGDLIIVCDNRARALFASPSFKAILGIEPASLIGQFIGKLVSEDSIQTFNEIMHSVFDEKSPVKTAEVELADASNSLKTFIISISLVDRNVEDSQKQYVLVGHDISNRKQTEQELLTSKMEAESANLAKSRFLASMSHELRTPLNAILGFAQILENANDLPKKYRDYVKIMHNSGEHLLSMINDILDLSKIEAGRMEVNLSVSSLHSFLYDLENMMLIQARKNKLALQFERSANVPDFIKSDFNKLRQVLINLIGNAIKYTDVGGVTVVTSINEDNVLTFEVRDTGPGIPDEQMERIFDAFHQVQTENFSKGTGLGLTISMKIAQLLGGSITVNSELGRGSIFSFHIPVHVVEKDEIKLLQNIDYKVRSLKKGFTPPTVMVVDDVDENRAILAEFLRQIGFNCYEYALAQPALNDLSNVLPDIILTDIIMPEMDGKEFLKQIKKQEEFKSIPVIAVTASIFVETKADLLNHGFDDFILKPINFDKLIQAVGNLIHVEFENDVINPDSVTVAEEEAVLVELFEALPPLLKNELSDALELLDEERLISLVQKMPKNSPLRTELALALQEKNYRFIINLNERLNEM